MVVQRSVPALRTVLIVWSISSLFISFSANAWSVRPSLSGKFRSGGTEPLLVDDEVDSRTRCCNRRVLLAAGFFPFVGTNTEAMALQPRNEPLCSTGLFENFMEYKCTPIGDIQDEGFSRDLTPAEAAETDSLLTKLGVSSGVAADDGPGNFKERK